MNPIIKPWPFRGWGMNMIGKINPPSSKGHQFILAIMDYFTKWVEAVPMKSWHPKMLSILSRNMSFIGSGSLKPLQQMEARSLFQKNSRNSPPTWASN
jgi:hypothetical protein